MTGYEAGAGAAAAAAAIARALGASGAIVRMEPAEFLKIIAKSESPAIVQGMGGFWSKKFQYLTGYKGLFFYTESKTPLSLGYKAEIIQAKSIWIPHM